MTDEIERGNAVVIAGDSFPVDDAGARAQARQSHGNQRETVGEIIARAAVEPHQYALPAGDDAEAIMLDLVQAIAAGRQFVDLVGRHGAAKVEARLVPPPRKCLSAIIDDIDDEATVKEKKEKALAEHVARHPEDVGRKVEDFNWIMQIIVRSWQGPPA